LIAAILQEPGADRAASAIEGSSISAVNFSEVAAYFTKRGAERQTVDVMLTGLGFEVVDADRFQALTAAELQPLTSSVGLSLGDRFCLALARERGVPAMTADRAWAKVKVPGIEIEVIR
jgi:PIN domain nuclease of toxin-antitoxin system